LVLLLPITVENLQVGNVNATHTTSLERDADDRPGERMRESKGWGEEDEMKRFGVG